MYKHLGHEIRVGRDYQTFEIKCKIDLKFVVFGKLRYILKLNIPIFLKRKDFNQCVQPVLACRAGTFTLTKYALPREGWKDRLAFLSETVPNEQLLQMSGVIDVIECFITLKWNWAGHVARFTNKRCTTNPKIETVEIRILYIVGDAPQQDGPAISRDFGD